MFRRLTGFFAAAVVALALWQLESARQGLSIVSLSVGETPATVYSPADTAGPVVVIAHGFAGSRQLMEAFALTFAQAGYTAVSFDFQGHGRNPAPMSGDVTRLDGTTARLVAELDAVIDAALLLAGSTGQVVLLGHSMASDIVVRQAIGDPRVAAVIAVSLYSEAVTAEVPQRLLVITGGWETRLREVALDLLRLVDPEAGEGETAENAGTGTQRRAAVAPMVEHLSVLYSRVSLREARFWADAAFDRRSSGEIRSTGVWIILLLAGLVLLAWSLAALLPARQGRADSLSLRTYIAGILLPAVLTPLLLFPLDVRLLPVLVADYLLLHFLLYGLIALALLYWRGARLGGFAVLPFAALLVFALAVFGVALDRYAASFMPHAGRIPVILAMAAGTVPFMLADSLLTEAGGAALWRRVCARLAFLASLGIAVALDFERLFFLVIILPVIVLFFLVFGLMGSWVGQRGGGPLAPGLALGLILAWAVGVSFPLVAG